MLIEIAGIDGSGKSTMIQLLKEFLSASVPDCCELVLRSTGKRVLDDISRDEGKKSWREIFHPDSVELAHALEMLGQIQTTTAPLDCGRVFLTHTYVARWLATASACGAMNNLQLARVYRTFPKPVASFRLSIPVDEAYRRLTARARGDRLLADSADGRRKLSRYAAAFADTANLLPYEQHVISSDRPVHDILKDMVNVLQAISLSEPLIGSKS